MKHSRKKLLRPEIMVFAIIIVFIAAASIIINVPQQQNYQSSLPNLGKAPELIETQNWINSEPLKIEDLKGKVVIVDFWTYTCINCIRTLPYLNGWHGKYADKGLVIIGIHTPEFEFEKDYNNVKAAVEKYGIKYAVVQDNNYATWRAYKNNYWPRKYIIDKDGNIRYDHIGEGGYEETEKVIQELLKEANPYAKLLNNMTNISSDTDFSQIGTPEIYLGYAFSRNQLGNSEGFSPNKFVDYIPANITKANAFYLEGLWLNNADNMESATKGKVSLIYKAKRANIVAGGSANIIIKINNVTAEGDDVVDGTANISEERLYNIVSSDNYDIKLLEIQTTPGLKLYTFTFG